MLKISLGLKICLATGPGGLTILSVLMEFLYLIIFALENLYKSHLCSVALQKRVNGPMW